MERLVNKKVRLQNRLKSSFLVACSDKESVNHVSLDSSKPKPENSVWVIKSTNPKKSVRLESVYGKFLGCSWSKGLTLSQVDKKAVECHTTWTIEDVDSSGFTCVRIKFRRKDDQGLYVYASPNGPQVKYRRNDYVLWRSWNMPERLFEWDLEIVKTPLVIVPLTPKPAISEEDQGGREPTVIDEIPTVGCIYQIQQMNIRNIYRIPEGTPANLLPYGSNDVNTGRNTNGSGTQIVGGATIHTRINHLVNKNIVGRDA